MAVILIVVDAADREEDNTGVNVLEVIRDVMVRVAARDKDMDNAMEDTDPEEIMTTTGEEGISNAPTITRRAIDQEEITIIDKTIADTVPVEIINEEKETGDMGNLKEGINHAHDPKGIARMEKDARGGEG